VIHTKHMNTLCGQNVGFVNVKPGGTYSNHWAVKGHVLTFCSHVCIHVGTVHAVYSTDMSTAFIRLTVRPVGVLR
jgi:hypothetical protein